MIHIYRNNDPFYNLPFPPEPPDLAPCGEDIPCGRCVWAQSCLDSTARNDKEDTDDE